MSRPSKLKTAQKRSMRQNQRVFFAQELLQKSWTPLYHVVTCEEKLNYFYVEITQLLDTHCPWKMVKRNNNDKPWITDSFRHIISQKRSAHAQHGEDSSIHKYYCNKVNRTAKRLYADHSIKEITSLHTEQKHCCWDSIKELVGLKTQDNGIVNFANSLTNGDVSSLCEKIIEFFVSVSSDPSPLKPGLYEKPAIPTPDNYIISVQV